MQKILWRLTFLTSMRIPPYAANIENIVDDAILRLWTQRK